MNNPHLDHVVLLVRDLDAACADMASLGFTILARADTKHGGTAFRFISLADGSYILLTAFTDDRTAASHRLAPVFAEGEGLADYSFTVDNMDAAIVRARAAGATVGKINDVRNVVQSGEEWALRLLVSGRGSGGDEALPFIVEDVQGRDIRIPVARPHANGATGVASMTIGSEKPAVTMKLLAALLGLPAPASNVLRVGSCEVRILDNVAGLPGRRRSGGLVDIVLRAAPGAKAGLLDPGLTHGARIVIAPQGE